MKAEYRSTQVAPARSIARTSAPLRIPPLALIGMRPRASFAARVTLSSAASNTARPCSVPCFMPSRGSDTGRPPATLMPSMPPSMPHSINSARWSERAVSLGTRHDCPLATALCARKDVAQQADIVEAFAGTRHIRAHQADLDRVDVRLDCEQARRDLFGGEAADIGEDRHPAPAELREARDAIVAAAARQAHGVGKRFRFGVAHQPRMGMARAGLRHDGADGEEAETENRQRADELAVLVEAGGEAHGAGKVDAGKSSLEHGIVDLERRSGCEHAPWQGRAQSQMPDRMRQVRRQGEQCRPDEALINRHAPPLAELVSQAANRYQISPQGMEDCFRIAHVGSGPHRNGEDDDYQAKLAVGNGGGRTRHDRPRLRPNPIARPVLS